MKTRIIPRALIELKVTTAAANGKCLHEAAMRRIEQILEGILLWHNITSRTELSSLRYESKEHDISIRISLPSPLPSGTPQPFVSILSSEIDFWFEDNPVFGTNIRIALDIILSDATSSYLIELNK